jgi:hypothetical protein
LTRIGLDRIPFTPEAWTVILLSEKAPEYIVQILQGIRKVPGTQRNRESNNSNAGIRSKRVGGVGLARGMNPLLSDAPIHLAAY